MLDPSNITKYDLNDKGLEERALFWICAAGKNGTTAAKCLNKLLGVLHGYRFGPFEAIRQSITLKETMKQCGIGCQTSKSRSMKELANSGLDLKTCTSEDLEKIYGIGMKTSRCFLLHSRKGVRHAGLDTHVLKYLRKRGVKDVPKSTPGTKKLYLRLEKEFLKFADEAGMLPAQFDLKIWNQYAVRPLTK